MPTDFKPGQAVRIHRPNRPDHHKVFTYVEPAQDSTFAWVALNKEKPDEPIAAEQLRRQDKYPRKLYPLSFLQPHEPAN